MWKNKKLLSLILICSLSFNILVIVIDTVPFVKEKFRNKKLNSLATNNKTSEFSEKEVLVKSLEIAESNKVLTIFKEHSGFTETIYDFIQPAYNKNFKKYNYPRAFLYWGISEYCINKQKNAELERFKTIFDDLIDENGNPQFPFDKVDQVPFGMAALNLYSIKGEDKYLQFSHHIYKMLESNIEHDSLVVYRKGSPTYFGDLLGMIIPFLVSYQKINPESDAYNIAQSQLNYYINYGVDKDTYIPAHGIDIRSEIKLGSCNWGRGIGWYLLGLSFLNEESNGAYKKELEGVWSSLIKVKNNDGLFTQFPGSSNHFDASTTTMFFYSFHKWNNTLFSKQEVVNLLNGYVSEGLIHYTSGDTYNSNRYSKTFGDSELSQGMLLLLLASLK